MKFSLISLLIAIGWIALITIYLKLAQTPNAHSTPYYPDMRVTKYLTNQYVGRSWKQVTHVALRSPEDEQNLYVSELDAQGKHIPLRLSRPNSGTIEYQLIKDESIRAAFLERHQKLLQIADEWYLITHIDHANQFVPFQKENTMSVPAATVRKQIHDLSLPVYELPTLQNVTDSSAICFMTCGKLAQHIHERIYLPRKVKEWYPRVRELERPMLPRSIEDAF